jgi:glycosyltransferase involved in cell wall biosynthesis
MFWKPAVLAGSFDGMIGTRVRGWVGVREGRKPAFIRIHIDGVLRARVKADGFRPDLLAAGIPNSGRAAFDVPLDPQLLARSAGARLEVLVEGGVYRLLGTLVLPEGAPVQGHLAALAPGRNIRLHLGRSTPASKAPPLPGFVLETPHAPPSGPDVAALSPGPFPARVFPPLAERLTEELFRQEQPAAADGLRFRIFGHIDGHYSLSAINRGLAIGLDSGPGSVVINHFHGARIDGPPQQIDEPLASRIAGMMQAWEADTPEDDARISVCHHYPLTIDPRPARLRLAFFFWEESRVPEDHVAHLNTHFDALLVATQFVRKVLQDSGCYLPIRVVPVGVEPPALPALDGGREVKRKTRPFRFLHVSSAFPRKGVDVLLNAFFEEFSSKDAVELVIKTFPNIHNTTAEQIHALRQRFPDAAEVQLDERFLSELELAKLYHSSDVVVLPTRGEGFNLPAAEAMIHGIPVIATGYGGQWDFLTGRTGWCLDFSFARSSTHVASNDSLWLEPSKDHLRQLMREFLATREQDPAERHVAGLHVADTVAAATTLVRRFYTWANAGRAIRDYASRLIAAPASDPSPKRLAWISSWQCRCGIAEYSKYLVGNIDPDAFRITHICDTRSAEQPGVFPLYDAHPAETLDAALGFVAAGRFDAIAVQYQTSLFDLAAALPMLTHLQKEAPVFVFIHSTRQFDLQAPSAETVGQLRALERIFVHTMDDLAVLKKHDIVENVTLLRHGLNLPVEDRRTPAARREGLGNTLSALPVRTLADETMARLSGAMREGEFWLATFGFLLPHKGIAELVDALGRLRDRGHDKTRLLLLCATLDERSRDQAVALRRMIEQLELSDYVILIEDFLDGAEINALLSAVDLIVYPYQETLESASGAIRIGLAAGRPILTTPLRIFTEVRGFTFQSQGTSAADITEAIARLLADPAELESRNTARDAWIADRSWQKTADRFSAVLTSSLADRRLMTGLVPARPDPGLIHTAGAPDEESHALLCPPGVNYPKTGRGRAWLSRAFRLVQEGAVVAPAGEVLAEESEVCRLDWHDARLALVLAEGSEAGKPLHLASSMRERLTEGVLVLDAVSIGAVPPRQRFALFDYARRHGLRTLFRGAPGALWQPVLLADAVCLDGAEMVRDRQDLAETPGGTPCLLPPRLVPGQALLDEVSTLRSLHVLGGQNVPGGARDGTSPLLAALQVMAEGAVNLHGDAAIVFGTDPGDHPGWRLLQAGGLGAGEVPAFVARFMGARTALLVDDRVLEAVGTATGEEAWLLDVKMFVFESPAHYRAFFRLVARRKAPVSLLRQRAVLLAAEAGEPLRALANRFARLLRTMHAIRLTDIYRPYGTHDLVPFAPSDKRLSICVSTYNRADWLKVTLPLLIAEAAEHLDEIEFLVVDNAATDNTTRVVEEMVAAAPWVTYIRNEVNVGMLGNLDVTARRARGDYVWIIGDDDLVKKGTVRKVLEALRRYPEAELVYINYAYTHFDKPSDLKDVSGLIASAKLIAPETRDRPVAEIRDMAANNENFFTAIYACVFRRDHALNAYGQFTAAPPFSNLASCIPTTKYVLECMLDRPGFWIGGAQIVVNMNVSWMRYAPVWHFERLPEAYNLAEEMGVPAEALTPFRESNLTQAVHFATAGFSNPDATRDLLSMSRYIEKARAVEGFEACTDGLFTRYSIAIAANDGPVQPPNVGALRAYYGL